MEKSLSLRERKKQETHIRLREAAMELFETKGYDQTTVEDIADEANVSRRTFFRYFGSKDEVIFSTNMDRLEKFRSHVRANDRGDRIEATMAAFDEITKIYTEDRTEISREQHLINGSENLLSKERAYDSRWIEVMTEELERPGVGAMSHVEAFTAATIMYSVALVTLKLWRTGDTTEDLEAIRDRPFDIMLQGLNSLRPSVP